VPSKLSERSYTQSPTTENRTSPTSDTLPASSVARNSTKWKPVSANSSSSAAVRSSPSKSTSVQSSSWLTRYSIEAIGDSASAASMATAAGAT
jgi:hypothetical protein